MIRSSSPPKFRLLVLIAALGMGAIESDAADSASVGAPLKSGVARPDWAEFRGPTGQGLSTATNVPIHWSATSNVVWKSPLPGAGWSSPVLANDRIYLTTAVSGSGDSGVSLRCLSLDAVTGGLLWDADLFHPSADNTRAIHQKNSLASPTPIVHEGRIYAHFGHMGTACLDLSGRVLWRQTGIHYSPVHGNGGSPVLAGDTLVFNCDGLEDPFVAGLDARTGDIRWKVPRDTHARKKFSFGTPLVIEVDGKQQVISPGSGFVGAYDARTGRELWRARYGEGYSVITRPVYTDGLILVSSSFDTPVLYGIRTAGARGDVTETHIAWSQRRGAPNTPSPVVVGGNVFVVSDSGIASCLEARTGEIHWNERLGGGFSSSPVVAEGRLYVFSEEGIGYVLRADRSFSQLAKNDLGERTLASPAVADNALFVRSDSHLWRLGTTQSSAGSAAGSSGATTAE